MAALLALLLALACPAHARNLKLKKKLAGEQFQVAEKMREALNGEPRSQRTRREYNRVIAAYRRVYRITPNARRADESIVDAAELLAEAGRAFHDEKASRDSVEQYRFLMKEYPGSRHRTEAMFTIGKIYQEDLNDGPLAKAAFEDFLKAHPIHRLSEPARQAIQEIDHPELAARRKTGQLRKSPARRPAEAEEADVDSSREPAHPAHGKLPLVTGIRHWSTPDYTRVAIDLEQEVRYEAGRIASPDRIFFDLRDTKLAPELVGKSFEVDDGFLRKVRIAQFQRGLTRVVLEVDPVSQYSAFLLPNPYRLIIDIHGKRPAGAASEGAASALPEPPAARRPAAAEAPGAPATVAKPDAASATAEKTAHDGSPAAVNNAASNRKAGVTSPTASSQKLATRKNEPSAAGDDDESDSAPDTAAVAQEAAALPTTKPTSAPTFEAVAPSHENSTLKKQKREMAALAREARPTADGQRSLIRALGLKIGKIVVDAGHGGHDTGTIGPNGLREKDLVLDVGLRLGKLLGSRMGADVVYTREDDTFVPLETRTAVANQEQADLFISIHANSSRDPAARGVETYYLNFTSSADALEVAARENAVSEKSIHELQDLVKKIALKEKVEESREFATNVQHAMRAGLSTRSLNMRDRGVKKAPFIVLIGANMPSVLAEISFVSNPADERRLRTPQYRQKIAESLYRGVSRYVAGLSGVRLASAKPASGQ